MSKKISELPALSNPNNTDVLPIVSGGVNKKITVEDLTSTKLQYFVKYYYLAPHIVSGQKYSMRIDSTTYITFTANAKGYASYDSGGDSLYIISNGNEINCDYTKETTATGTVIDAFKGVILQFSDLNNVELRPRLDMDLDNTYTIYFDTDTGAFSNTYTAGFVFKTGATAPVCSYANTNIIQWVGTDCSIEDGFSLFIPQPNKKYNIIITYDGEYFEGLVCGFEIATRNE